MIPMSIKHLSRQSGQRRINSPLAKAFGVNHHRHCCASSSARIADRLTSVGMKPVSL